MRPTAYHGIGRKPPFFEGWYYKLVTADQSQTWAIIPGIYYGKNPAHSTAFVMVINGRTHEATWYPYPVEEFSSSPEQFLTRVGGNVFSADFITLNLPNLQGHLDFHGRVDWPVTLRSPGIMGWFAWMPFMECYHGIVSLDHTISGELVAGGETIDFANGRGYTEKDWGQNFPQTWVWLQANHFDTAGTSLTASVARIPFKGRVFPGFIIGLWHNGELHRFTTYRNAKLEKVAINGNRVEIVVKHRSLRLEISAERNTTALLHKPTADRGMIPAVHESVDATTSIRLTRRKTVLYEGYSTNAGLEIEGDTRILETR